MTWSAWAPGKLILFGEHAVVYGTPALAIPLPWGLRVRLTGRPTEPAPIPDRVAPTPDRVAPWPAAPSSDAQLSRLLTQALELIPEAPREVTLHVESELPPRAGLGSSAALAVALLRGLATAAGRALPRPELLAAAAELEGISHGNPSGVDHTTVALAEPLVFRRGRPPELGLRLGRRFDFVLGLVGEHGATAARVAELAARRARLDDLFQELFRLIGLVVDQARRALAEGDGPTLGALLDFNQGLLRVLGASSPALEQALDAVHQAGALGAKLSGAGSGGALVALCREDPAPLVRALRELGHSGRVVSLLPDEQGLARVAGLSPDARSGAERTP